MYDYDAAVADWPELTPEAKLRLHGLLRPGLKLRRKPVPPLDDRVQGLMARMSKDPKPPPPPKDPNGTPHPNPPVPLRPITPPNGDPKK